MSILGKIFGRRKKLTDIPLDEIRREEKRLEIKENQYIAQIDKYDKEKEGIFHTGSKTNSVTRRKIYARRFNDCMMRISMIDRELGRTTKELMTVARIRGIMERKKSAVSSILSNLNEGHLAELEMLLEDDKVSEEMYTQKLDGLLGIANDPAFEATDVGNEGMQVLKTWEAMDEGQMEFDEGLREAEKKMRRRSPMEDDTESEKA
jgi:hypothetical protein